MSVTTALQQAGRTIGALISGDRAEPEILDTLKKEHEEVGELLKKLVDSDKGAERRTLLAKIKAALLPHLQAEQTVLYDALIAIKDDKIKQDGHEGYIEHELASATLSKLEKITDANSPEFAACAKVLKELIEHHVQEEERNVWADAKEKFSPEERRLMNVRFLAAKHNPPARVTPPSVKKAAPPAAKTVAPARKIATASPKKAAPESKKAVPAPKKAATAVKASAPAKPSPSPAKPVRKTA